jgi:hypothetical protein
MRYKNRPAICRRELLAGAAYLALGASRSSAAVIFDHLEAILTHIAAVDGCPAQSAEGGRRRPP